MVRRKKYVFSFSWKRAANISAAKGKLSRQIDIPLTKAGQQRRAGKALECRLPTFVVLLLLCGITALAQEVVEPEIGSIETIKNLHKVYVITEDDDRRATITKMLGNYPNLEVVNSPKDAEFYLEMKDLTRDVAATRSGGAISQKSQMRAFIVKPEIKVRVIAWSETETFERHTEFFLGASNEVNLTKHFINAMQAARGEKKSSMGDLFKKKKH